MEDEAETRDAVSAILYSMQCHLMFASPGRYCVGRSMGTHMMQFLNCHSRVRELCSSQRAHVR